MGGFISTCNSYAPNSTLYPCPSLLPTCASNIHELYCMVNSGARSRDKLKVELCSGELIKLYARYDDSAALTWLNLNYRLTIPEGVQIGCQEAGNCTIERAMWADLKYYPFSLANSLSIFLDTCPFFTYDLNTKISITDVLFRDIYPKVITDFNTGINGPYVIVTAVRNSTDDIFGVDNLKPIAGPLKIEATSKGSTFSKDTQAQKKKKKRGGPKGSRQLHGVIRDEAHEIALFASTAKAKLASGFATTDTNHDGILDFNRQLQETQLPFEVAAAAADEKAKLASAFAVADINLDGLLDCSEIKIILPQMTCDDYLKYFTGGTSGPGVTYSQLENIWLGGKPLV